MARNDDDLTAIEKRQVLDIIDESLRASRSSAERSGVSKQWAFDKLADDLDRYGFELRRKSSE